MIEYGPVLFSGFSCHMFSSIAFSDVHESFIHLNLSIFVFLLFL